ncbi:protein kinase [Archangium violaceum]|uniref:serine/threonine protein kinase n=1 Tax=Archangium violaceum TaxID=83451 RepID=UPI00193B1882|nr:serine/threonine-protein kinase [Archangium violaceum]QRK06685.1 protein kinase [Archangium violaceum]
MGLTLRHPDIGEMIGDYKVVGFLGAGGLGIVYKVERGGCFFALKLLLIPKLDGRGKREIGILIHLENPGVVRYVGSDFWPDPVIGHPYIVMEYVPGDTLWTFAYKRNPSARKATRIILDAALTLGEVHAAGVFHRDVKPENIVIREGSERPILIDFGIGSLASAPTVTGSQLPPGTEEFRSPEQIRFQRANPDGTGQYEYGPADEMWALGVTYYWLLTDALPFGERTDEGRLDGLRERILTQRPEAPHVINPRVPLAASLLCMKMLAEQPEDRFPLVATLCAALNESLSNAENAATWEPPLVDPLDPQTTTTLDDPAKQEPNEQRRMFLKLVKRRPRRGQPSPNAAPVLVVPAAVAGPRPPAAAANQDKRPKVDAPRVDPAPVEHEPPVMSAPVPPARELEPAADPPPQRAAWRLGVVGAVLTVAVVALSVGADLWGPGSSSRMSEALPSTSPAPISTDAGLSGREVAPDAKPLESLPGGDAAPVGAQLPASTANAMARTSAQTPKNETTKTQTQGAGFRLPVKPAAVAVCALLDGGCTAPASQVRPEPPAISCPEGWQETHERLHVKSRGLATLKGYKHEPGEVARVKEGPATLRVESVDGLPENTLLLGTLQLGEERLFGTFTQAQIPGAGTVPVCLVIGLDLETPFVDERGKIYVCGSGLGVCLDPGSKPGNAKVYPRFQLHWPTRF